MADFDDFENSQDPAADFLAREQDQLAGIEDDEVLNTEENDNNLEQAGGDGLQNGETEPAAAGNYSEQLQTNGPTDQYSAVSSMDMRNSEPEKIRKWREEHKERLEEKDKEEEKKKEEWREIAKKELEDWKKHNTEQLEKSKATNREAQAEFVKERDQTVPGQEWERVARLCDFNPKGSKNVKDVSRMRSILLQLKQNGLKRE